MLVLNQVSEVAKKLPEERDRLVKEIYESTWEHENHKNLALKIVPLVDIYHLHVYEMYVYMTEISISVNYRDFDLENGNTLGMDTLIKTVCKEINEISPILQFSLAGHEPVSDTTISIKIRSKF